MKIAKLIGVSNATVCRWGNGQTDIRSEEFIKVAKFVGLSSDYLIGLED